MKIKEIRKLFLIYFVAHGLSLGFIDAQFYDDIFFFNWDKDVFISVIKQILVFLEPQTTWQKSIAFLTPVYSIKAIKRTWTLIPMKKSWARVPGLVPGQAMTPPLLD